MVQALAAILFRCRVDVSNNQARPQQGNECGIPSVDGVPWISLYSWFVVNDGGGKLRVHTGVVGGPWKPFGI